jgi:hypothetical protein
LKTAEESIREVIEALQNPDYAKVSVDGLIRKLEAALIALR